MTKLTSVIILSGIFSSLNFISVGVVAANEALGMDVLGVSADFAVDSSGQFLVTQPALEAIVVLDSQGNLVDQFGGRDAGDGDLRTPSAIAIDSLDRALVTDRSANGVKVFDAAGNFLSSFTGESFSDPRDIAIDANDNVYVLDDDGLRLFDATGAPQPFSLPSGIEINAITLDDVGNLYTTGAGQVRVFEPNGQPLFDFSVPQVIPGHPFNPVVSAGAIAVGESGIVVAGNQLVYKFDPSGDFEYASIGHQVARTLAFDGSNLLALESSSLPESFIRSVDEATLRTWDGRTFTDEEQGPFGFFNRVRDNLNLDSLATARETAAERFQVPGPSGEPVELTFTYQTSTSGPAVTFGVYEPGTIDADLNDPDALVLEILDEGQILLDRERNLDQAVGGNTVTYSTTAGTELGFFLFTNGRSLADLDLYRRIVELGRGPKPYETSFPAFSESSLNWGGLDQMLSFIGDDESFFTFENIKIGTGGSDFGDFTDIVVSVDMALIPVPEPTVLPLIATATLALLAARRRPSA